MRQYLLLAIIFIVFIGCASKKPVPIDKTIFKHMIKIFYQDNKSGAITSKHIENQFEKNGFIVSLNMDINSEYKEVFGDSSFKIYNILTLYRLDIADLLLKDFPQSGALIPLNVVVYQKDNQQNINIGFLSAKAQAKILGAKQNNKLLLNLEASIIDTIKDIMPKAKAVDLTYTPRITTKQLLTTYKINIDKNNWNNDKDEFEINLEKKLKNGRFLQVGFTDINFDLKQRENLDFDFYDIYSLYRLKMLYHITNKRPEAGVLALFSLYIYKHSKEHILNIGSIDTTNLITIFDIEDNKTISILQDSQKKINIILKNIIY